MSVAGVASVVNESTRYKTPSAVLVAMQRRLELRHASPRTIEAYVGWVRRFIRGTGRKDPSTLGEAEVTAFLSRLATDEHVSASTQNQALAALLFLYKEVLGRPLAFMDGLIYAKRPKVLPVVLSPAEVSRLLDAIRDDCRLMASLLYGSGLRLTECLTLRVKDIDVERRQLTVRRAKGAKDRVALLPETLRSSLLEQLGKVRAHPRPRTRSVRRAEPSRSTRATQASEVTQIPPVTHCPSTAVQERHPSVDGTRTWPAGTIRLRDRLFFIASALHSHLIGLEEINTGLWSVYLRNVLLAHR